MYKRFQRFVLSVFLIMTNFITQAQDSLQADKPEMADAMRANGKIYVVVGCLLIVLAGLFLYLFVTDRKLRKLERKPPVS